jgi:hypothetical protein
MFYLPSMRHFCQMITLINPETTIKDLLEINQELVIPALIKLNKSFSKLRNPILRRLLARRVSIADACKIAGCSIDNFIETMKQVGFTIEMETPEEKLPALPKPEVNRAGHYRTLDVRPILAQDKDPLKEIMTNVSTLEKYQGLKLINTFAPLPLIHLLADRGFSHFTVSPEDGVVITYFYPNGTKPAIAKEPIDYEQTANAELFEKLLAGFSPDLIVYLDVRQLEMPKPMLSILERLLHLGNNEALFVHHKKIPVYLLPELEKQGVKYAFKQISPGDVHMLIYKS